MSVEPDGTEKYHDGGRGMCFLSSQFITVIISHVSENPEDGVSYTKWASQGSCLLHVIFKIFYSYSLFES